VLEEILNNVGQQLLSLAITQLHALSLLQKTVQIRDQFFLYVDPVTNFFPKFNHCGCWASLVLRAREQKLNIYES
jgi:hypothetical protein